MVRKIGSYFKSFVKKSPVLAFLAGLTLVGIILSMVFLFETPEDVVTAMPLFISIIIMLLQSEANRYALLLGSINSIFYAVVYFMFGLHASALSALCLSFPIQLLTFIRWNKNKYKNSTVFKKMSWKMRGLAVIAGVIAVLILNVALEKSSEYYLLDNISNAAGISVYILTYFSFVEYPILQILGLILGSTNYIIMMADGQYTIIPHLIYNAYCLVCLIKAAISVFRLYREQQKHNDKTI